MLRDPDVDAVVVVTRRHATGPIVLDALGSGRHVFSEKPMAHTAAQARMLSEAAVARRLIYTVGYMKRHDAGVARAKAEIQRIMADGSFGATVSIRGWCLGGNVGGFDRDFVMTAEDRPDGLSVWPMGPVWLPASLLPSYDAFLNVNIHIINLLRFLIGTTPSVSSTRMRDDGTGVIALEFNGVPCILELATTSFGAWNEGCEIRFERGLVKIELQPPFCMNAEAHVKLTGPKSKTLPEGQTWAFRRQADAFVMDIVDRTTPLASGADSVIDLVTSEAIWRNHLKI
ncbi:MAG TPA: Gfo/Idh/MocA family oxidoreductase [Rhizomicrobium sp.]